MRGRSLVSKGDARAIGSFVFAVAFVIRAYWVLRVQRPHDAVYSDMAGYVLRADLLLSGRMPGEPRMLAIWPWGTHAIVAGQFALFGRQSAVAIGLCNAFVGALAAPCASALTARFVGRSGALVAGLAVACWHPHIVFTGYFSSEIWFTSFNMLCTLFVVRRTEGRRGGVIAGLALAASFVVRPQILLTAILFVGSLVVARVRGRSLFPRWRAAAVVVLVPLCLAMGFSAVRYRRLMGHYGLISSNEPIQRLFGDTDVILIEAAWTTATGERWTWWFAKTGRGDASPATTERFEGYIADGEILSKLRRKRLEGVGLGTRIQRKVDNVVYLAARNVLWPESNRPERIRRLLLARYATALFPVLALAVVGLFSLRRHRAAGLLLKAQLATIVGIGALYVSEVRYRVPYDPILLVVATVGLWKIGGAVMSRIRTIVTEAPS